VSGLADIRQEKGLAQGIMAVYIGSPAGEANVM
jgi:hypothetical protein